MYGLDIGIFTGADVIGGGGGDDDDGDGDGGSGCSNVSICGLGGGVGGC